MIIPDMELRIATYNVRGLSTSVEQVQALIQQQRLDILIITETFMVPYGTFPTQWKYEALAGTKASGGVAIWTKRHIEYKRIFDFEKGGIQGLAIRVGNTSIVGTYLPPHAPMATTRDFFEEVNRRTSGRVLIIGDLNSNNTEWGFHPENTQHRTSTRGKWLGNWVKRKGWDVYAPSQPSYYHPSMRTEPSTPDILVAKGCRPNNVRVEEGPWDGSTDHMAVISEMAVTTRKLPQEVRISKERRKNPALVGKAKVVYPKLTYFNKEFDEADTQEKLRRREISEDRQEDKSYLKKGKEKVVQPVQKRVSSEGFLRRS